MEQNLKKQESNFYLGFIPKKWPSLFLFFLGIIFVLFSLFFSTFLVIMKYSNDSTGLMGAVYILYCGGLFVSSLVTIYSFLFCFFLRNLKFKDFLNKEIYARNIKNIIYCFVLVIVIYYFVGSLIGNIV